MALDTTLGGLVSWYDTLTDARELVKQRLDDGVECPCCETSLRRYKRKLNSGMARGLIILYRAQQASTEEWLHVSKYFLQFKRAGIALEYPKLRYWGLLEPLSTEKVEGRTPGFWRVTDAGKAFVRGSLVVQKRVWLIAPQQRFDGFDGSYIGIREALGEKFDYEELMRG